MIVSSQDDTSPYSLALNHEDSELKKFVLDYIRYNRLTAPNTAGNKSAGNQDMMHPLIPTSGKKGGDVTSPKKEEVRTLDTLSREILAAQQEVMAHQLSTALEAVAASDAQDTRRRPARQRSFKEALPADGPKRRTSGDTLAAGLAAASAAVEPVIPPTSPELPELTVSSPDSAAAPADMALPGDGDVTFAVPEPTEDVAMTTEDRHEPEGQEHGYSLHEVNDWFSGKKKASDDADGESAKPIDLQKQAVNAWYSSDGDSTLPKETRQKPSRRSRRASIAPRYHYMPVYQPVLTPYGYMLTQSLMPVPIYTRQSHQKGTRKTKQTRRSPTPAGLEDVGENEELRLEREKQEKQDQDKVVSISVCVSEERALKSRHNALSECR